MSEGNKQSNQQELHSRQGQLTIFLGCAPGVGKTAAMIDKAYDKLCNGTNVVIGWLGLDKQMLVQDKFTQDQIISPTTFEYPEETVMEMNLAAIISANPQLVVIEDLAHINAHGARHIHRYQDVKELLRVGIDVYTTLNIYQVESLQDVVSQITGIKAKETVIDRVLETADYLNLVDMPSEDLMELFEQGTIAVPPLERKALSKLGNINALRELALRYTAQKVDRKLTDYMKGHAIQGPWPAGEKILACISTSPFSTQVIRAASRMATGLKAELIIAYVDTPKNNPAHASQQEQLIQNIRLAQELGTEVISLMGDNVAEELLKLAFDENVTQIVIGKPLRSRFRDLWRVSIVNEVVRGSKGISVHVIPGNFAENTKSQNNVLLSHVGRPQSRHYLATVLLILGITLINKILDPFFDLANIALLYLLPVLFSAVNWGYGPSIMASLLGMLSFDVFFVPPQFSITVHDLRYLLSFAIFLLVAITTSTTAVKLKNQVNLARVKENRTAALYSLSRKIVAESDIEGVFTAAVRIIANIMDGTAAILVLDENGKLQVNASTDETFDQGVSQSDKEKVEWVYNHGEPAGRGTETFCESDIFYLPIKSDQQIIGVLAIRLENPEEYLTPEQKKLLDAFANLIAVAIIRLQLAEEAQQAHYLAQSEKLRTALLNSVSHEIRTPLASIIGAITSLLEQWDIFTKEDKQSLLQTINESAQRMDRLVKNLLDMARLESGRLDLKWDWCDMQDVLGVALRRAKKTVHQNRLKIDLNDEIPLVKADFALIEQVLVNLIDNAAKYSPLGTGIEIVIERDGGEIKVMVNDQGTVIPVQDRDKIFDKFYRTNLSNKKTEGTGLGLSICRGFIEAHGGKIWAEPKVDGGNCFIFTLPISKPGDLNLEVGE